METRNTNSGCWIGLIALLLIACVAVVGFGQLKFELDKRAVQEHQNKEVQAISDLSVAVGKQADALNTDSKTIATLAISIKEENDKKDSVNGLLAGALVIGAVMFLVLLIVLRKAPVPGAY